MKVVARRLGSRDVARILCVSELPASPWLKSDVLQALRRNGVDGILLIRTMLLELVGGIDKGKNYEKSDLMQVLRILKSYDLIKDRQMELFGARRSHHHRTPVTGTTAPNSPTNTDETGEAEAGPPEMASPGEPR